jgi:hypothetical protein
MDLLWIIPALLVLLGFIAWKLSHKPRLDKNVFYRTRKHINATEKLDPNHALMDAHKAFISALQSLYPKSRTNGATLIKRVVKRLPNEKVIWKLHRMRNLAAHQPNFEVYEKTASQARHEFMRALKQLS